MLADKVLSTSDLCLEIGESGSEVFFKGSITVKWNEQLCNEGIYEVGAELKLGELQRKTWDQFFKNL